MRRSVARAVIGSGRWTGAAAPPRPPRTWNRHGTAFGRCQPWLAQTGRGRHPIWGPGAGRIVPTKVGTHQQRAMPPPHRRGPAFGRCQPWLAQAGRGLHPIWGPGAGRIVPTKVGTYQERVIGLPALCQPTVGTHQEPIFSSALPPLPMCSASTWPRSSGPRHPAPG